MDTDRNIFEDSCNLVKHFPGFPLWKYRFATFDKKQFCTPRAGKPGSVLLISRNSQNYFIKDTKMRQI